MKNDQFGTWILSFLLIVLITTVGMSFGINMARKETQETSETTTESFTVVEATKETASLEVCTCAMTTETIQTPRYGFSEEEIVLMARLLSGDKNVDGDGEFDIDFEGADDAEQVGLVLCVVMNRVRSDEFPDTVEEVIFQKNQFTPVSRWKGLPDVSDISLSTVRNWCEMYDNYDINAQVIPESHLYFIGNGKENKSS